MAKRREPSNLKRTINKISPKQKFILVCEGGKTERDYFIALKEEYCGALVEVEFVGGVGVPITVANKAIEESNDQTNKKENSFECDDEIWAVFDKDEHPSYDEAIKACNKKGVGVAYSNPCFELWLYLHIGDYDKACNHKTMQQDFSTVCSEYTSKNKTANCLKLVASVEEAEKRAITLLKRRESEGAPNGAASTKVGFLTKKIRQASRKNIR